MRTRRSTWVLIVALVVAGGCGPHSQQAQHRPVPFTPPVARSLAPADDPTARPLAPDTPVVGAAPMRVPRHVLALSGGGVYGAYSSGFLAGWTGTGTRPEFDVVTGISTGSLLAPLAFLGPAYDAQSGQLYTRIQAQDVFRIRTWVTIPFTDAAASSAPLKALIQSQVTQELLDKIAAEHRKGRRLYVGTTNLDTRRLVVWDMGAIACRPCPEGCLLFRDVLLASSSVPGMLPPVRFDLEVDGQRMTELHVDGGATAQVFVPANVFAAARFADETPANPGNLYVIVSGKLYPDAGPVKPKVLPILGAATGAVIYAACRADLANLYGQARGAGMQYHLAALRQDFVTVDNSVKFDQVEMTKLFQEGLTQGMNGPNWISGPPGLNPGDGDYIRTGLQLVTPPGPVGR